MSRFNEGDLVRLKTGSGPRMVVAKNTDEGYVTCVWFVNNEKQYEAFSEATLERTEKPTGSS